MPLPVPGEAPAGVVPRDNGSLEALLRQFLARLSESERKTLFSAVVSSGGLTIQDGGLLRVRLPNGVATFYVGPLTYGDPPVTYNGIIMKRPDGSPIFYTFPVGGDPNYIAWKFTDQLNHELISSDAITGGLARPWIPILLDSRISMPAGVFSYYNVAVSGTERQMWEGRIPLVSHPFVEVDGIWGQASGTNTTTYRLKVGGTTIGTWSVGSGLVVDQRGPFDVSSLIGSTWVTIELTVQSTGSGNCACHVNGCALRQT